MKKYISFLILAIITFSFSPCEKDFNEVKENIDDTTPLVINVSENEIPVKAVELFAKGISENKGVNFISPSKKISSNYKLEPIYHKDIIALWVINYDDGAYVLLSGNKNKYPIIEYSDNGNFIYSNLNNEEKAYYDDIIRSNYNSIVNISTRTSINDENDQIYDIWEDIIELIDEDCEDCEYEVEIEFSNLESNEVSTRSPGGPGTISNRDYMKGYRSVYPLLERNNRKWNTYPPYNYNMNKDIYNSSKQFNLSSATISLAKIMDYYKMPDAYFWARQPNELKNNQETEFSKFLRTLTDDLGGYQTSTHFNHDNNNLDSKIPDVLYNKYGFQYAKPVSYSPDQAGFDAVRLHLQNYGPVMYVPGLLKTSSVVIDGVAELYTKVTTKKKVLGITYKTKVKYYYCDYFHFVGGWSHWEGWQLYDDYCDTSRDRHQVLLLKKR